MSAPTILELLNQVKISEEDWLLFGKIWREYGSRDPQEHLISDCILCCIVNSV